MTAPAPADLPAAAPPLLAEGDRFDVQAPPPGGGGGGGGGGGASTGTPRDTTPVGLILNPSRFVRGTRRLWTTVNVRCSEFCGLLVTGRLQTTKLPASERRPWIDHNSSGTWGWQAVQLELPVRLGRLLTRGRTVRMRVTVQALDNASNRSAASAWVRLRRTGRR
jgi:hypothetical protein